MYGSLRVSSGTHFFPGRVVSILRVASWPEMAAKAPEITLHSRSGRKIMVGTGDNGERTQ